MRDDILDPTDAISGYLELFLDGEGSRLRFSDAVAEMPQKEFDKFMQKAVYVLGLEVRERLSE